MISLSIFAASFFKRKILALQVISFTSYPIFFLTGYAWPDFAMPKSLYWISQLIPSTPFFDIYNRITFTGAGYLEIKSALLHLLILTLAGLALAFYRMRKLFTNN
jgi:ABC-2 type transport system permease protein